jgi:NAD(P)-dependent dehydrogenase (short-subunit alcohol dehydrogenase family)
MKIGGSIALVTGANRGLGAAFCRTLLDRGATKVYAAARDLGNSTTTESSPCSSMSRPPRTSCRCHGSACPPPRSTARPKAAGWSLTNSLRQELIPRHIQVLGLYVGYMATDMTAGIHTPKIRPRRRRAPYPRRHRIGRPRSTRR